MSEQPPPEDAREAVERAVCRGLSRVHWDHDVDDESALVDAVLDAIAPHIVPRAKLERIAAVWAADEQESREDTSVVRDGLDCAAELRHALTGDPDA